MIPTPSPVSTPQPSPTLTSAPTSWVYQLQSINIDKLTKSEVRYVVIDPSLAGDGDSAGWWSAEQIRQLKDSGKTVLAYLSIGEAESYRDYWLTEWKSKPPSFLHGANQDGFEDNYTVAYWEPQWQEIVLARLRRIESLGFDGVYLDKVDAFEDWGSIDPNLDTTRLRNEMVTFIERIEREGRANNPTLKIFLQNAYALWTDPRIIPLIDGAGLEEFSLGWEGSDGEPTPTEVRTEMEAAVRSAKRQGWVMLVVDYPKQDTPAEVRREAVAEARRLGAVPLLAPRDLDGDPQ